MRTIYPHEVNKGFSSKFVKGYHLQQTPEEGRRIKWPKHYDDSNKDEDTSVYLPYKKLISSKIKMIFA